MSNGAKDIIIRDAQKAETADLVILDNLASHGFSHWFWQEAVLTGKAEDAYAWGRSRFAQDHSIYGWKNARLALLNDLPAGACTSYIMPENDGEDAINEPDEFKPVVELFALATGHWFVDSLAVYPEFRGHKIGSALVDDSLQRARHTDGVSQASLVAEDSNTNAINLYKSRGFVEQTRRKYIPFNNQSKSDNWLLLTATIH